MIILKHIFQIGMLQTMINKYNPYYIYEALFLLIGGLRWIFYIF